MRAQQGDLRCQQPQGLGPLPLKDTGLEVMGEELSKKENAFPDEARGGGVLCPAHHSAWPHPCSIPTKHSPFPPTNFRI